MRELYLSLGSNLGDRLANIKDAIKSLERFFCKEVSAVSQIMEYESWGFSGNDFLNCAVMFSIVDSGADPILYLHALLREIKRIERSLGRNTEVVRDQRGNRLYSNRQIDIDILFYGNINVKTSILEVPHPLIAQRQFVLEPLRQIASGQLKRDFPLYFKIND